MGIHFTDLLTAAQLHIAGTRSAALKTEIAERHRQEVAELAAKHATEKEANANEIESARTNYLALLAKIAEDSSSSKKAIEETVQRQVALMIEAEAAIPNLLLSDGGDKADAGETMASEATAPAVPPAKRRGRKSNAEKAAEAAAAAAAASTDAPASAPQEDPAGTLAENASDGDLSESDDASGAADEVDPPSAGVESGLEDGPAVDSGEVSENAADEDAPLEQIPVTAEVVESLTAGGETEASTGAEEAAANEPDHASDFGAPAASAEETADQEEDLDGFAALDAISNAGPVEAEEEFEVPGFLRR
ncbi:MAG: hypothetical protein DI537_05315 [Stutzerimonas stutzeri]|nr:MAG: hypothetical protein DI537_05315 [Stutzerimonas stutzeri]